MRRLVLALLLTCTCIAPAIAADDLQPLLEMIEARRIEHGIPGVGVAIVSREGVLWTGGFGVADLEAERPFTADTIVRIGDITKMFTSLATATVAVPITLSPASEHHRMALAFPHPPLRPPGRGGGPGWGQVPCGCVPPSQPSPASGGRSNTLL